MEISLNWLAIIVISIVSFFGGAAWHGKYLFGPLWMRIHYGKEDFTPAEMQEAMRGIWKLMLPEFIATLLMVTTLDFLMRVISTLSPLHIAFMVWIGYVLPTMTSTVVWWADPRKWMTHKILISASFRLAMLLAAAYVLSIW